MASEFECFQGIQGQISFLIEYPCLYIPEIGHFSQLQSNLIIASILYSGHLSTTDNFLRSGLNDGQTLITKPPFSGHFIADTSLYWTSFLGFNSHYLLQLTSLQWARPILDIACKRCVYISLQTMLFYFVSQFNGLFSSMERQGL